MKYAPWDIVILKSFLTEALMAGIITNKQRIEMQELANKKADEADLQFTNYKKEEGQAG